MACSACAANWPKGYAARGADTLSGIRKAAGGAIRQRLFHGRIPIALVVWIKRTNTRKWFVGFARLARSTLRFHAGKINPQACLQGLKIRKSMHKQSIDAQFLQP